MAAPSSASTVGSSALWILVVLATVWFLRTAQSMLIPIALAVLISYALEPVVARLERWRVPRIAGSAVVLLVVLGTAAAGAYALRADAMRSVEAVPMAVERVRAVVASQLGGADVLGGPGGAFGSEAPANEAGEPDAAAPSGAAGASLLERVVSAILAFAGHAVVIVFLVYFLLMSGHHVRNRLVEVAGPEADHRHRTATIIDEINAQIQRYLLVVLLTSAVVGVATWLVLVWIGVRQAAMWALLAGIFNSIPYFGPVIVSGGLFLVGLAQGGGMTQALQMSGAALVITSLEGWLLTPPLMGKVERMSALAVFLGLLLWTWLWGAWGTVLAVPMLAVIKSTADHVPQLRPVGRLMAP